MTWKAVSLIEGWESGWKQTAELIAAIHNAANRIVTSNAADPVKTNEQLNWLSGNDVVKKMNQFKQSGKLPKRFTSIKQAQAQLAERYGRGN